jgi:hypothetical protein
VVSIAGYLRVTGHGAVQDLEPLGRLLHVRELVVEVGYHVDHLCFEGVGESKSLF